MVVEGFGEPDGFGALKLLFFRCLSYLDVLVGEFGAPGGFGAPDGLGGALNFFFLVFFRVFPRNRLLPHLPMLQMG